MRADPYMIEGASHMSSTDEPLQTGALSKSGESRVDADMRRALARADREAMHGELAACVKYIDEFLEEYPEHKERVLNDARYLRAKARYV